MLKPITAKAIAAVAVAAKIPSMQSFLVSAVARLFSGRVPERGSHTSVVMTSDDKSFKEDALEAEIAGLRELLSQAGIDAARLLAQSGIDAAENDVANDCNVCCWRSCIIA